MSTPCTASKSGSGSIRTALFHAFDLQNFGDEIADYYYWFYSEYYIFRQSDPLSLPGEYSEQTSPPMSSLEAYAMLEACVRDNQKAGAEFTLEPDTLGVNTWWPGEEENVWRFWAILVRNSRGRKVGKKTRKRSLEWVERWSSRDSS